jgi:signal transduction histidine kinase
VLRRVGGWVVAKLTAAGGVFLLVPLAGLAATLLFWQAATTFERDQVHRLTSAETSRVVSEAGRLLRERAEGSLRAAERWLLGDPADQAEWNYDAYSLRWVVPELLTIEWVGPDLESIWWPVDWNAPVAMRVVTPEQLELAVAEHRVVMMGPLVLPDRNEVVATIVPIERGSDLAGWVVTLYDLGMVLRSALAGIDTGFTVVAYDGQREIFSRYPDDPMTVPEWQHTVEVSYDEFKVYVVIEPLVSTVERFRSPLPRLVLVGGLLGSLALALVVRLGRVSSLRSAEARMTRLLQAEVQARRVAEKALERKVRELSRSNREFERFAYAISHDLRDPLNAIALNLQVVLGDPNADVVASDRDRLEVASRGVVRIDDMLGRLLRYSSVGRAGDGPDLVDVGEVVDDATANLQALVERHEAHINQGQLPQVIAYRSQLTSLFQNLLANSMNHRSDLRPEITVDCMQVADEWTFSVADNGRGMDEEQVERAFELFWRREDSAGNGSGIGLAICKRIVELHGGRAWIVSTPGEGTTFYFTLPAKPDLSSQAAGAISSAGAKASRRGRRADRRHPQKGVASGKTGDIR